MTQRKHIVLIAEDDPDDQYFIQSALKQVKHKIELEFCANGKVLLERVKHRPDELAPHLLLLDLNMPGMNGHDFLNHLRRDEKLFHTIVFVLTSSTHPRDIRQAYEKHVAGYLSKDSLSSLPSLLRAYRENVHMPSIYL